MLDETLLEAEEKMEKAIEVAKEDFASIRTGRANPALFTKLLVDYYGSPTPLQQLASFQTPEARTILITPFDKSAMHEIEKTLREVTQGTGARFAPVETGLEDVFIHLMQKATDNWGGDGAKAKEKAKQ